jgi:hypothetical protein
LSYEMKTKLKGLLAELRSLLEPVAGKAKTAP